MENPRFLPQLKTPMHSKNTNAYTQEAGSFRGTNLDRRDGLDVQIVPDAGDRPVTGILDRGGE